MVNVSGSLRFNRELKATEIVSLSAVLDSTTMDVSKPNNGLIPFRFTSEFDGIEWDGTVAYEMENCLKVFIVALPQGLVLDGNLIYDNPDEFSYKIQVLKNAVKTYKIDEPMDKLPTLLRCPHCQKAFKKEDFKEEHQ
jgi:hypothetical protein